ncbi:MAG: sulfite exporter TauE/SafE family protein [Actinobacteria bacterium]|nr:sulfite exporter TauE/SafE family protein [Actinomycetota bacterium]
MSISLLLTMMLVGFLIGVAKTAVGGLGLVSAALLATVLSAKESTGVILVLLLVGDLFAISIYKKHVEWKVLKSLIWPVAAGLLIGVAFLARVSDLSLKRTIGWIVLVLVAAFPISQRLLKGEFDLALRYPRIVGNTLGSMAGFMSMIANAGGPPMSIYLLLRRNSVMNFLGNNAWFFFILNASKVPFMLALGIIKLQSLQYILPAVPTVAIGAMLGRKYISRINQQLFQNITLVSAAAAGINLVLRS